MQNSYFLKSKKFLVKGQSSVFLPVMTQFKNGLISKKFRKIAQNRQNWSKLTHKKLIFMCVVLLPPEHPAKFQRVLIAKMPKNCNNKNTENFQNLPKSHRKLVKTYTGGLKFLLF